MVHHNIAGWESQGRETQTNKQTVGFGWVGTRGFSGGWVLFPDSGCFQKGFLI